MKELLLPEQDRGSSNLAPQKPLQEEECSIQATVRTGHGTTGWFQIRKGVRRGCILSPAYLTYMQSTQCIMPGWMKH